MCSCPTAIGDNAALSQKMVSEWTGIFEPLGLALHKTVEHVGLGAVLMCDVKAFLDAAAGSHGTLALRTISAAEQWSESLDTAPSWVSHLGEHCARFTPATVTFSPATSGSVESGRK